MPDSANRRSVIAATCGAFALAFAFDGAGMSARAASPTPDTPAIDWMTSPLDLDLRGMNGERYRFRCPPGKPEPSRVTGSGPYTDTSSICTAAVHAGALRAKDGGVVTIEIRPGQSGYRGSRQNYIDTRSYDRSWSGSFVVIAPAPRSDSPSR